MNRACPECGQDFLDEDYDWEQLTPYEENDKLFTLQLCSPECRDAYKE